MWSKLKEIFSNFASLVISLILLVAIIVAGLVIANKNNDDKKESTNNKPDVAQVFEPSISTPLPADVIEDPGKTEVASTEDTGKVAGDSTNNDNKDKKTETTFVAPKTGINPSDPIAYKNSTHGINVTLPAHTNISEQSNLISFGNLFSVNIVDTKETLNDIAAELSYSNDTKNIQSTTLSSNQALKFSINGNTGYVVIKNNKAYYLIGQDRYITQVKI